MSTLFLPLVKSSLEQLLIQLGSVAAS